MKYNSMLRSAGWTSLSLLFLVLSCGEKPTQKTVTGPVIKEEKVTYQGDSVTMVGYYYYDSTKQGQRPGILVVPEWWGLNDYPRMRARKLAGLGYAAMAIDMYGNGLCVSHPDSAGALAGQFNGRLQKEKDRFDAAMARFRQFPQVDTNQLAAIGYCFGGGVVLNVARMGEPMAAAVSFHGDLAGAPAKKDLLKAKILVCHGGDDQFVKPEEVQQFRHQMDSIGADYTFKIYPNSTHDFTNPNSTRVGQEYNLPIAYNPTADTASWNDMKVFFEKVFQEGDK